MDSQNTKKIFNKKVILAVAAFVAVAVIIAVIIIFASAHKDKYRVIKIKSFEGDVKVQRENQESFEAFEGLQLVSEDTMEVGKGSFLELLADSDKHIGAGEETGFIIHSSGTSKKGSIVIELLYGKALFTIDNKLNEDSLFDVQTPNATMSVRGTTFSVEYNQSLNETTVEVMEGRVWITAEGQEQMLEAGDSIVIGGNASGEYLGEEALPVQEDMMESYMGDGTYDLQFMIDRYYQNVPEYASVPAENIEIFVLNDISNETASVTPDGSDASGSLAECALEIDRQYIEPLMDKANEVLESRKYELVEKISRGEFAEPMDVTDWFEEFDDREITINGDGYSFTFEITRVTMDWIYGTLEPDENGNYMYCHTIDYDGGDGNHYTIVAVSFTFEGITK